MATGEVWMSEDLNDPLESFLESEAGQEVLVAEGPPATYGSAKGLGSMTPDSEDPLEEFRECTGRTFSSTCTPSSGSLSQTSV